MNTHLLVPKLIAAIMSLLDSANLRNRVYEQQQRIEQLELAIEDIERISASRVESSERHRLIKNICTNTKRHG
jgi:hypothetical protein